MQTSTLAGNNYKIIGISSENPNYFIVEIDKNILESFKSINRKKLVSSWLNDQDEGILKSNDDINDFLNRL